MPYLLEELPESGEAIRLGEPVHDVIVAKVIASRRALRTQRTTIVVDASTGQEVARYDPASVPKESMKRLRAAREEVPDFTYSRKKSG